MASDLDNDGNIDLVVVCGETRTLHILLGRGNGQFKIKGGHPVVLAYAPNEVVIVDMNRDGKADLVVGSHDSYVVTILMNDGKANFDTSFSSSITMRAGDHPHTHGLGVSEVNGDGYPDIITANSEDHDISVMLSNGSGGYKPATGSPFPVNRAPYPLTLGDVNADGHVDIVSTTSDRTTKAVTVLTGNGRGNFSRKEIPLKTASPWFVAIGDINNDKIPDMVMTHTERSELTALTSNRNRGIAEVTGSPFNLSSNAWHVALADINRDDKLDVLAAANEGVRVMLGDGKGRLTPAPGSPFLTGKGTWHLAITDVNNDGRPDVVTSNLESKNISVLLGR